MAVRKPIPPKKLRSSKGQAPTGLIPKPPPTRDREVLNVEIARSVGWRLKMALVHLEAEGQPIPKKAFVEAALAKELDRFDAERGA